MLYLKGFGNLNLLVNRSLLAAQLLRRPPEQPKIDVRSWLVDACQEEVESEIYSRVTK